MKKKIIDMLNEADERKVRLVYVYLRALLGFSKKGDKHE